VSVPRGWRLPRRDGSGEFGARTCGERRERTPKKSRDDTGTAPFAVPRAHHVSKDGSAPLVHPSPLGQHKFSTMY